MFKRDTLDLIQAIANRRLRGKCMICNRENYIFTRWLICDHVPSSCHRGVIPLHPSRDGWLRCSTCFNKYANSFSISEEIDRVESESLLHEVEQEELYGDPYDRFVNGSDVPRSGEYQ